MASPLPNQSPVSHHWDARGQTTDIKHCCFLDKEAKGHKRESIFSKTKSSDINNRNLFLRGVGARTFKIKVPTDSLSGEGPSPFTRYSFTGQEVKKYLESHLELTLISFMRTLPPRTNDLLKASSHNTSYWGEQISTFEFGVCQYLVCNTGMLS